MTNEPSIAIVIVAYQTRDELRTALASLQANAPESVSSIVVVDNASTDGTAAMVAAEFPEVELRPAGGNVGFAAGCNLGAEGQTADLLLFLNPDTEVPSGTIEALLDAHRRNPDAGQIGGRTFDDAGNLDPSSCWGAPSLWSGVCFATGLSAVFAGHPVFDPQSLGRWPRDTERDVGVVTGCLALMPRSLYESIGGFDETYFLYGEDVDLSMRVRDAGYRTMITPDAVITHSVGAASSSSAERGVRVLRGTMTLFRLRFGPVQGRVMRALWLVGVGVRAALPDRSGGEGVNRRSPWRELFRRRAEWRAGYPDLPA